MRIGQMHALVSELSGRVVEQGVQQLKKELHGRIKRFVERRHGPGRLSQFVPGCFQPMPDVNDIARALVCHVNQMAQAFATVGVHGVDHPVHVGIIALLLTRPVDPPFPNHI